MSQPENPSAFPVNTANDLNPGAYGAEPGMTLRDWFAGQALTGWMHDGLPRDRDDVVARECYAMADAMLTARAKPVDAPSTSSGLLEALDGVLAKYTGLVESGDAGFWDAEKEPEVIAARAAIAKAKGGAA